MSKTANEIANDIRVADLDINDIKLLRQHLNMKVEILGKLSVMQLRRGMPVKFTDPGNRNRAKRTHTGTIQSIGPKNVKVKVANVIWTVPASMIEKV